MDKDLILSYIYLNAILPNLEDIIQFDNEARKIIRKWHCSILFDVSGGPKITLFFKDEKLEVKREKTALPTVAFWFSNPQSLNKMFEGKTVIPLIWKGFWHIGILKNFIALTKKIEPYMKPKDKEFFKTEENLKLYLTLMLNTLIWGIKVVGENDDSFKVKRAMNVISKHKNQTFQVEILPDGPCGHITISNGNLLPSKGKHPTPTATLLVKDKEIAYKMFNNELDFMVALGTCDLRIVGLIPFAEAISILMGKLREYLPE